MARTILVQLTDDLDGGVASETVAFGLDGKSFEIDLSAENAARLRTALEPFVGGARRAEVRSRRTRASADTGRGYSLAALRAWAEERAVSVPARGRIPGAIVEQFLAERSGSGPSTTETS